MRLRHHMPQAGKGFRFGEIYDALSIRAKALEALMGLPRLGRTGFRRSDPLLNRPGRSVKLFGVWTMWHDRGLGLVYSTALGAWTYLEPLLEPHTTLG